MQPHRGEMNIGKGPRQSGADDYDFAPCRKLLRLARAGRARFCSVRGVAICAALLASARSAMTDVNAKRTPLDERSIRALPEACREPQ